MSPLFWRQCLLPHIRRKYRYQPRWEKNNSFLLNMTSQKVYTGKHNKCFHMGWHFYISNHLQGLLYIVAFIYSLCCNSLVQWDSCVLLKQSCHILYSTFQCTLWGRHKLDWKRFYPRSGGVIWLFWAIDAKRRTLIYSAKKRFEESVRWSVTDGEINEINKYMVHSLIYLIGQDQSEPIESYST